jgi:hypothetical protein
MQAMQTKKPLYQLYRISSYTIAVPTTFTVCDSGCDETSINSPTVIDHIVPKDHLTVIGAFTENVNTPVSGTDGNEITLRYGAAQTGTLTVDEDEWIIINSSQWVSGARSDTGSNNEWYIERRGGWNWWGPPIWEDDSP